MQISLLNPLDYVRRESELLIIKEVDIATEIFLAEKCARIHYEDLMSDVPEGTASKSMLIAWVNDSTRNQEVLRQGVLDSYMSARPEDFIDGKWQPLHFHQFIAYTAVKLTDKVYVGKSKAEMFSRSFQNIEWLHKASAVMGLKLLERLHRQRALKSVVATVIMDLNRSSRELLEDNAKIFGRAFKNKTSEHEVARDFKYNLERYFKQQWDMTIKRFEQHEEYRYYDAHRKAIESSLLEIPLLLRKDLRTLSLTGNAV